MTMQTRAQKDMLLAERLVTEASNGDERVYKIYGGLCHNFPVLVRTCGLCQALAFHKAKAANGDDRARAHQMLLKHVGTLLGEPDPLDAVRRAETTDYMLHTRRALAAWIYFKRFAESILNVSSAESGKESGPS